MVGPIVVADRDPARRNLHGVCHLDVHEQCLLVSLLAVALVASWWSVFRADDLLASRRFVFIYEVALVIGDFQNTYRLHPFAAIGEDRISGGPTFDQSISMK